MVRSANNQSAQKSCVVVRAGFSMMDLMVSIAVIAILIAILLPSLGSAMESTRRVKCQSNLRMIGIGLQLFADNNEDRFPDSVHATARTYNGSTYARPEQTLFVRMASSSPGAARTANGWDGLGILVHPERQASYLDVWEVLYCPSHAGNHARENYSDAWISRDAQIAGNFQYRLPIYSHFRSQLDPAMALVSDGLREKSDYNHKIGNNLLKVDSSVSWYSDDSGLIYEDLVEDGDSPDAAGAVDSAWGHLDLDPKRPVSHPPRRRTDDGNGVFASSSPQSFRR